MNATVVGAGMWGTAFARLLADRGHDVTLACHDAEQAHAIAETGRNPRALADVDLAGIVAVPAGPDACADADVAVIAVPSRAFAEAVATLPDGLSALSLTKGLDPATGSR